MRLTLGSPDSNLYTGFNPTFTNFNNSGSNFEVTLTQVSENSFYISSAWGPNFVEDITEMDDDKVGATKTRISVKTSNELKGKVRFRDIETTDTEASQFIYFFVTVFTNNMYETMRHAEEVITSSVKYHFSGVSDYGGE